MDNLLTPNSFRKICDKAISMQVATATMKIGKQTVKCPTTPTGARTSGWTAQEKVRQHAKDTRTGASEDHDIDVENEGKYNLQTQR